METFTFTIRLVWWYIPFAFLLIGYAMFVMADVVHPPRQRVFETPTAKIGIVLALIGLALLSGSVYRELFFELATKHTTFCVSDSTSTLGKK